MRYTHVRLVCVVLFCVAAFTFLVVLVISTPPNGSVAQEANTLCKAHQGVSQDGIAADWVICKDGYVAER